MFLPTQGYHPLQADSPAVNAGNPAFCPSMDQRGVVRVGSCDIGAYEFTIPGVATNLSIVSGNEQRTAPNFVFPKPLLVAALDNFGSPVPDVNITFNAPGTGASAVFSSNNTNSITTTTDETGVASAPLLIANSILGPFSVSAEANGTNPVSFALENMNWYVASTGNDSNNCATAKTPCLTINGAINKADSEGVILVANGIYSNSNYNYFGVISKSITIDGGWDTTFIARNGQTVIDGQNIHGGFIVQSGTTVTISNMTIQNGQANSGAGIYNDGDLTLRNLTITNNQAQSEGGGIYQRSGNLNLENVTISNNIAQSNGGGIFVYSQSGMVNINNSTIHQNFVTASGSLLAIGGGISNLYNLALKVQNSIIAGNGAEEAPDCYGQIISGGHNLVGLDVGCNITPGVNDQIGTLSFPLECTVGQPAG
ncbi:MAG: right-handed parallel beta-helix repeat-containing protein [Anaerolineales bacterium]